MANLYANPYATNARGFYFSNYDEYEDGAEASGVEEFEIQFIDGNDIEQMLFRAMRVNQGNLEQYFDAADEFDEDDAMRIAILMEDLNYDFDYAMDRKDDLVVYGEFDSDEQFAQEYVDSIGSIADALGDRAEYYFDYDAFGRDLRIGGDLYDPDDPDAEERWAGMSDQEIGEEWTDEMGGPAEVMAMLGDRAEYYFDWSKFARDLMFDMSEYNGVYYDPNSL